jgi:hypothetical protein
MSSAPDDAGSVLAEFADAEALAATWRRLADAGVRSLEAWSPSPVADLRLPPSPAPRRIQWAVLCGALAGGSAGYGLQWWTCLDYPLRVGAMPMPPWPAFIPITFESAVLGGCLTAFAACLIACRLPAWWQPLWDLAGTDRLTIDRYALRVPLPADAAQRAWCLATLQAGGARCTAEVAAAETEGA